MARGFDAGTMFCVKSELNSDGQMEFSIQRNCFLQVASSDDTEDVLRENKWSYAKSGDSFYILGEDAIKLKNLLTMGDDSIIVTRVGELRRPMKDGLLNIGEETLSAAMIQEIIKNLVGSPSTTNEHLCFCVPGDPVDRNMSVLMHQKMLTSYLQKLGYTVEFIPEALAIVFAESPTAESPDGEYTYSGIGISCGAGMMNICLAWKKIPLISFSIARSGDWIDEQVALQLKTSRASVTKFKETKLDLNNINYGDMRQAALAIYYRSAIEHAIKNFSEKFNKINNQDATDSSFEIVVAGGTAMVPGFLDVFKEILSTMELPFKVKNVRLADEPLYTVAAGCLVKALSSEKKAEKANTAAAEGEAAEVLEELEKQVPTVKQELQPPLGKIRVPKRGS